MDNTHTTPISRLATFQANDEFRLFHLAKQLHEQGYFKSVLNHHQYQVLSHVLALDSLPVWKAFLEGQCTLQISTDSDNKPGADDENWEEGPAPALLLALNVRFLLWEKAIDFYFTQIRRANSAALVKPSNSATPDYTLLESLDVLPGPDAEPADKPAKPVRDEEDDYDDDDDEEEESSGNGHNGAALSDALPENITTDDDGRIVLLIPRHQLQVKLENGDDTTAYNLDSENGTNLLEERDAQLRSISKIYHNFEYDRETLIKRRKLEKSDMQLEKPTEGDSPAIAISFGLGSHLLQHLLSTIRDKRDEITLLDLELRSLFMDIRKNRGKWANDERVGQEELYEACEKVLLDLRGYTEHLTPFLNKVSKREAPNYGLIVKKPMDLNTVMKKLKALAYLSKNAFVDDLMLIWNNCLLYNADPKHFLRAHAIAMQKRTQKLVSQIPDIVIRNRADLEKNDEDDEDNNTPVGAGKLSKKGQMRRQEKVKVEELDTVEPAGSATPAVVEDSKDPEPEPEKDAEPEKESERDDAATATEEPENEDEEENEDDRNDNGNEDNEDLQDAELQAWKVLTAKSRANYCLSRAALFDESNRLRMDADAIMRDPKQMSMFDHYLTNHEVVAKGNKLLDNDEPYLLEYDIAGGIPELGYAGVTDEDQEQYENAMAEELLRNPVAQPPRMVLPKLGLNGLYLKNITMIQEIRKICFKILLIRQMQTQQYMHRTQMQQPEIEYIHEDDLDPISRLGNHDLANADVQYVALRRAVAKVIMHTGFETTEPCAANTLTQVAERYMASLARLMKLHRELVLRNVPGPRELVLMTLLENGVDKPDDLYTFVQEKVKKNEAKLEDLRVKLQGFLKELLRPSLDSLSEQNFDDNSEQFTTGDFTSELGDDFFGFKELGLDKEFKMLTLSVPVYLLHLRLQSSLANSGTTRKSTKYEDLTEWQTVKLLKAMVPQQIGLLQGFYQDLVQRTEAAWVKQQKRKGESTELPPPDQLFLLEDDELPQKQRNIRPRLPPTGKISSIKKKPLSTAYILPEDDPVFEQSLPDDVHDFLGEIKMEA